MASCSTLPSRMENTSTYTISQIAKITFRWLSISLPSNKAKSDTGIQGTACLEKELAVESVACNSQTYCLPIKSTCLYHSSLPDVLAKCDRELKVELNVIT